MDTAITDRWLASVARRRPRSDIGRYRQGATLLGITVDAYQAYVEAGRKWCSGHAAWEPRAEFGTHVRRPDGLNTVCRAWDRQTALARQRQYRGRTG